MTLRLGSKIVAGSGGSIVHTDDITITKNEQGIISTQAVSNKNSDSGVVAVKSWVGTLAEYEAIENKSNDVIYYITDDETLAQSANISLSNLSEEGEKHFLNKQQITNCLLEVPQTVIYETTGNSITIKRGSTSIVPNGANVFDRQIFDEDLSYTLDSTTTGTYFLIKIGNAMSLTEIGRCSSGATNANTGLTYSAWYDTTNNIVKRYGDDTTNYSQGSLPLMKVTCDSGEITSIDQIFNGMGYIGSTIFVDKGVKGLIPDGRNEDGTLMSIEFTTENVLTKTKTGSENNAHIRLSETQIDIGGLFYSEYDNLNYLDETKQDTRHLAIIGTATLTSGVISGFNPKLPFRAVDYNDYTKDLKTKADKTDLNTKADKSDLNTKVNKSGDTMTGHLNLKSDNIDYTYTTTPTTTLTGGMLIFRDKNNNVCGQVFVQHQLTNNFKTALQAKRSINGTETTAEIMVAVDGTGNTLFEFPKCTTRPSTTSSASANKVAVVVQNYLNGTSWYRVWSDGWKEQGGYFSGQTNGTVTLLKSFSDTNYTITMATHNATVYMQGNCHGQDTGSFKLGYTGASGGTASGTFWYACGY